MSQALMDYVTAMHDVERAAASCTLPASTSPTSTLPPWPSTKPRMLSASLPRGWPARPVNCRGAPP